MGNWYKTGFESALPPDSGGGGGDLTPENITKWRYWMPNKPRDGWKNTLTFVDDTLRPLEVKIPGTDKTVRLPVPILCMEHNLHLNGSWKNFYTCLSEYNGAGDVTGGDCPLCRSGDTARELAFFTVIDHAEWTDKSGKVHKDELRLYAVKTSQATYAIIQEQAKKRKGLRGCKFEISRMGDKSCNVGNVFDFEEKVELPDDVQPFNYLDVLKQRSPAELARLVGATAAAGEDPLPF